MNPAGTWTWRPFCPVNCAWESFPWNRWPPSPSASAYFAVCVWSNMLNSSLKRALKLLLAVQTLPAQNRDICWKMRLSLWWLAKSCNVIRDSSLSERCFWILVGPGAHRPPVKLCASWMNQRCSSHSRCSALSAVCVSAPPAGQTATAARRVRRACQLPPSCLGKTAPTSRVRRPKLQSNAVLNVKFTLREMKAVPRWCVRTASMPSVGTAWSH